VTWGDFAATLAIEACPPGLELLVDTAADEADGGATLMDPSGAGATLSFREAMTIGLNRDGPKTVRFAAGAFPADTPATIPIPCNSPVGARQTCIDGRRRGVILTAAEVDAMGIACSSGGIGLSEGSAMIGVSLQRIPTPIRLAGSSIAGCRLNTDGTQALPGVSFFDVSASRGSVVGPGNVFMGGWGLSLEGAAGQPHAADVQGNYFGMDPLSMVALGIDNAIEVGSFDDEITATVTDNVFLVDGPFFVDPSSRARVSLQSNWVGTDKSGSVVAGNWSGISGLTDGAFSVERNLIRSTTTAAVVIGGADVLLSANRIFDNADGIVYGGTAPVDPPVVTRVDTSTAEGTCATPGTVEVFSDAGSQGGVFIGTTECDGAWSLSADIPSGRNVTATLSLGRRVTSAFSAPVAVP